MIKMRDERLKIGRIVGGTHVNFDHERSHKNHSNPGQEYDGSNDTNGFEHLWRDRVQRGWAEGVESLSRTILSCVLKPIRNPVPARETMVPTANKTRIAHELHLVNHCGQMGEVRNH